MNQAVFSPPAPQQAMNLFAQTTGFGYDESQPDQTQGAHDGR